MDIFFIKIPYKCNLKVSHPRCVVKNKYVKKILFLQSQNTTKHKTKFITILQQHVSA